MSKNKKGNGHHHLTLSDGIYIESEMNIGSTFKSIADTLGKDPSTPCVRIDVSVCAVR